MHRSLPHWSDNVESLRPFACIELVAIDLDGTLLQSPDSTVAPAVQKLKRHLRHAHPHVRLSIATGRAFEGSRSLLQVLSLDRDMPVVLYNGGMILRPTDRKILHLGLIYTEPAAEILRLGRAHGATVFFYVCKTNPLLQSDLFEEVVYGWGERFPGPEFNGLNVSWQTDTDGIGNLTPVAILIDARQSSASIESIASTFQAIAGVNITTSGSGFIEFRPNGCDKGAAVGRLASFLGLEAFQVLAIGDNDNDAEMLEFAGIGVCVAGASQKAEDSSDFKCRYNVVNGVIEVLRIISHAKRYFGVDSIRPSTPTL